MNVKRLLSWNSFYGRIILMILIGIGIVAVTVSAVVLGMSRTVFTENYAASQEKVLDRIEKELDDFHNDLQEVITAIDTSPAFRLFLSSDDSMDNVENFQNIYQMENDLEQSKSTGMDRLNILVLGTNGAHYLSRTETISAADSEIWASDAAARALADPDAIHYSYAHGAFTATTKNSDVVIISKALYYGESKEVYAVVLVTLTMEDLKKYYDYFVTEQTSFYMVAQDGTVMCADDTEVVGQTLSNRWYTESLTKEEGSFTVREDGHVLTVAKREMPYIGCSIYGIIDNDAALDRLYNMPLLVGICAAIAAVILAVCLFYASRTMRPLSALVGKMSAARSEGFKDYMPVEGTVEVRELALIYNRMLDDINSYIERLMDTQKKQQKAEIQALQMQINPHYIYNTLAGIKWLIYQNDVQNSTKAIDAFISLLRNTISNTDEFITVDEELTNLKNYALINQIRYGDAIKVEYYVSVGLRECLIPKLILQPFVENAFFHAFPSGRTGTIQIFVREKDGNLQIRIEDDGIGMEQSKADMSVQTESTEHFSGIGINNVQERLKLLYGKDYGIQIKSTTGEGTTVTVTLPVRKSETGAKKEET